MAMVWHRWCPPFTFSNKLGIFPTFLKSGPGACWIWKKSFGPSNLGWYVYKNWNAILNGLKNVKDIRSIKL